MALTDSAILAAAISGVVSLIGGVLTAVITLKSAGTRAQVDEKLATARAQVDREMTRLKAGFDKELAEQKDRLDNRTIFAAEQVARELMMDREWRWRSFRIISHHLGGFEDAELRKILVRAGAIRVTGKDGTEYWGLIDRNRDYIGVERLAKDPTPAFRVAPDGDNIIVENFDPAGRQPI
jgi:hypothetical protein